MCSLDIWKLFRQYVDYCASHGGIVQISVPFCRVCLHRSVILAVFSRRAHVGPHVLTQETRALATRVRLIPVAREHLSTMLNTQIGRDCLHAFDGTSFYKNS